MIILKNKIKVVMIFVFSAVILTLGISVAYYNTCSLAFDGEPVIACVNDEKISFLDFSVSRKELKKIKNERLRCFFVSWPEQLRSPVSRRIPAFVYYYI